VLPTIKSRTHHYPFRLVPPSVLRPYLERLCAAEGVTVEPAVFPLVVRAGGGSVRDSLSVLDQLIAGAGPDGVAYARAVALLGVTDAALLDELCDALAVGDGAATFQVVDRVIDAGHDPRRFAADLLERLRDLLVMQQVPEAASKGLLDAPADQLDRMAVQASQLGPATLTRCAEIVHSGLVEMRGTASPRLLLELICARMLLPGADDSGEALLHRLERMERRLGAAAEDPPPPATPAPPPAPAPVPPTKPAQADQPAGAASATEAKPATAMATEAKPAAAPGALDAAAIRRVWDEIVATVGRRSKRAAAVVREATVRDVEGGTIVLLFQHTVHASMLAGSPQQLLDAIHEVLGGSWQIRCEARDVPSNPAPRRGAAAAPEQPAAGGAATGGADWPEPARPGGASAEPEPARVDEPVADPVDEFDEVDVEGDARTAAATSEQQALDLLQQSLGAEKIGEVAP
jgi:DNA polymerase III subunit gamma/tau